MVGNACASAAEIARDGAALLQSSLHRIEPLVGATLDVARAAGASAAEVAHDGAAILQSTLTTLVPLADTTLDVVRAASANTAEVLCKHATRAWSAAHDLLPLCGATLDVARAAWTSGADLVCKSATRIWLWVLSFTFATAEEPLSGASQSEVWAKILGIGPWQILVDFVIATLLWRYYADKRDKDEGDDWRRAVRPAAGTPDAMGYTNRPQNDEA
ncbi:hypothetical protein IWQ56_001066 [Coemansia nantahalensis]|nr:hypothetical protein IWQ56_001066 [Coemansia nantahalensis]